MSKEEADEVEMEAAIENSPQDELKTETQIEETENVNESKDLPMPSQHQQVEMLRKKYGGLLPKKPPLISKDHEHAFFDSADWALGKQGGQKAKGPLEALRPKLEPTPHHHARSWRSTFAPAHDNQDTANSNGTSVAVSSEDDHACVKDEEKNRVASSEGESTCCDPPGNP